MNDKQIKSISKKIDKECQKEAIKRGYKGWTDWFINSNPKETHDFILTLAKKYYIPYWRIGT
jgi:hypothetical protein